ncbi:MAG: hypothetical protein K9G70_08935 [Prolixibacteraceae bacterium]|nr:hypothetical protein [Prolixibacteraceae bacterium]
MRNYKLCFILLISLFACNENEMFDQKKEEIDQKKEEIELIELSKEQEELKNQMEIAAKAIANICKEKSVL